MGTLLHDVRFAVRLLARTPALTLVAVLSLGLGIGANTAIFTLINEVFLRPLPLRDPTRLVGIFTTDERNQDGGLFGGSNPISRLNFEDYRDRNQAFEGLAAASLRGGGRDGREG